MAVPNSELLFRFPNESEAVTRHLELVPDIEPDGSVSKGEMYMDKILTRRLAVGPLPGSIVPDTEPEGAKYGLAPALHEFPTDQELSDPDGTYVDINPNGVSLVNPFAEAEPEDATDADSQYVRPPTAVSPNLVNFEGPMPVMPQLEGVTADMKKGIHVKARGVGGVAVLHDLHDADQLMKF
ncbi:MAG TPA: hypothetical protein VF572_05325 [Candidatus Saccharimonadales bacterium]|jgi:hypothetical protein